MELTATPEWIAYRKSPEPSTLMPLWNQSRGPTGLTDELLSCLNAYASESGLWRVSQHAAQAFLERGIATEAQYHATKAVERSRGHVMAHVALARAFELRRLPGAVFPQLDHIHVRLPMLPRGTPQRARVSAYLASAFVRNYCYIGNLANARPWVEFAQRSRFTEPNVWIHLLNAALRANDKGLAYLAAQQIAKVPLDLSARENARLLSVWRLALLRAMTEKK